MSRQSKYETVSAASSNAPFPRPMENTLRSLPSNHAFVLAPVPDHTETMDDVVLESYDEGVPDFLEYELGRLYRSVFCSLTQFRIHGGAENASVYVAHAGGHIRSILLYRIEGRKVVVINQCFTLEDAELARFAAYIFQRFSHVDAISFRVIDCQVRNSAYPVQAHRCSEDFVLALPRTVEEYHSSLGKSTRSYVNRYLNKLRRTHPSFTFEVHSGESICQQDVEAVFLMNRQRMAERGMSYGYDAGYPARTTQLLRETGLLCLAKIDGSICAGTILYEVEGEYYLDVLSHKSEYSDLGLGTLCCYLSIGECIRRGGKVYHFLWGRYDYKLRLGGVERPLSEATFYRSRLHMLMHPLPVLKHAAKGRLLQMKRTMYEMAERDQMLGRVGVKLLQRLRRTRAEA